MLDFYKLQIFSVVAQEGSFSAAAERLYVTQSAVSQHIKDLEASLGKSLFQRGRRGVKLTPAGEILYQYAREIFELVARAENAVTDVEQIPGGKVTIGATPGIAVYLAPDWIQRFRSRFTRLTVAVQTGVTAQIVADVLARRLDLGFIEGELDSFRQPRLGWLNLEEIEQKVIVGEGHPWWNVRAIQIRDLHQQSLIVRPPNSQSRIWLDLALRQHGVEPIIGAEFDNLESIKRAVAGGLCAAILPEYVVQQEIGQGLLRALPVEGKPLRRTLKLIWDQEVFFTPITRAFLGELSQEYSNIKRLTIEPM